MFYLILFSLYILFCIWFNRILQNRLYLEKIKCSELRNDYNSLLKIEGDLSKKSGPVSQKAESVVELYEITKDVTRSLEEDVVFNIFKEKLKHYIKIEDIQFIKENIDYEFYKGNLIVPLDIGIKQKYFLVAKGIPNEEQEKFYILTQQFLLGLKRAYLYYRIQDLAIHDTLTAVLTHRYFLERLEEEIKRSGKFNLKFSFLMVDIDHFKECNDRHGHLAGDVVLREIAGVIKESTRQIDIVGRYGGEEFSIILTETSKEDAINACERIRKNIEDKKIKAYDEELSLTISIGVSGFPGDGKLTQELIDKSDWALYRAKQTGRNRICVYGAFK